MLATVQLILKEATLLMEEGKQNSGSTFNARVGRKRNSNKQVKGGEGIVRILFWEASEHLTWQSPPRNSPGTHIPFPAE